MLSRKRRRSQASPGLESQGEEERDSNQFQHEREIWETFREENYEAIEQLPLTLQRQLFLMRQLDEQANGHFKSLLPVLQRYITLRHARLSPIALEAGTREKTDISDSQASTEANELEIPESLSSPSKVSRFESRTPQRTPSAVSLPSDLVKFPNTSRGMLSHIAWLSEELGRAAQEKVNLAQTTHDSIERHIRMIDQAILEQESSLDDDNQLNTNILPILLSDLVVPRWSRSMRVTISPDDDDDDRVVAETKALTQRESSLVDTDSVHPFAHRTNRKRYRGLSKGRSKKGLEREGREPLKITLPPTAVNATEVLYCYCNNVFFGKMIGCDGPRCEHEWFHLACVGLTTPPVGRWYCAECRTINTVKK